MRKGNPIGGQLDKIQQHCADVRRTYRLSGAKAEGILVPLLNPSANMIGFSCTVTSQKFWLGLPAVRKSEWTTWFAQDGLKHAELARILSTGGTLQAQF